MERVGKTTIFVPQSDNIDSDCFFLSYVIFVESIESSSNKRGVICRINSMPFSGRLEFAIDIRAK
jgi:hypothetical protein